MSWVMGLGLLLGAQVMAQASCPLPIDQWASQLTAQLPRYSNLVLIRSRSRYRLTRVGEPEIEQLSETQARLWFMTAERDATTDLTLERAYQVDLSHTGQGWDVLRVRVAQSGTLAPRDASFGAVAQAIATWQRDQCPAHFRTTPES